jgi:hypothetical protein
MENTKDITIVSPQHYLTTTKSPHHLQTTTTKQPLPQKLKAALFP